MNITYYLSDLKNRKKQPLLSRTRAKYRAGRSSEQENVETNLIRLDISRISSQIDAHSDFVDQKLKYFLGINSDITEDSLLADGLSYSIDGVQIYLDKDTPTTSDLVVDTIDVLSTKVSRLADKISRLERER